MGRKTANTTTNNTSFEKADAFLRLELVDANGNRHRLPKDVALYVKNFISAQLVKAATADAEKEFNLVGKIHIVKDAPKEDLEL